MKLCSDLSSRALICALCLSLVACGGGGGSTPTAGGPTPSPTPTASNQCSLRERQLWAEAQIRENYLFPEDLPASLDPAPFSTVQAYIDALTATARAKSRDKGFTYITSIAEENAFFSSGQTAAFGIRLQYDSAARRTFIIDAFETGPAFAAGIDRGDEILAIGTTPTNLVPVTTLFSGGGSAAVSDALGPTTAGVTRTLELRNRGTGDVRTVTITRAEFNIPALSPRFGSLVFDEGANGKFGYINLRSFISSADAPLREAFARFRAEGISQVIIDVRYNSGGLVRTSELMGDLLGGNRLASDVYSFTTFRPSKSASNTTRLFRSAPESVSPTKIAFITTESSASASESVPNSMLPYLRENTLLVGGNTAGKPVGQIGIDRAACDDRLRVVAFALENANRQGDYFNGLAPLFPGRGGRTCAAADQFSQPFGRTETSISTAISAMTGGACSAIASAGADAREQSLGRLPLLASTPSAAQRDMPGLF
ncbi:S41 family peptidase [Sandarakinorhabdus sp.]|uniref:S41 family peptidase n=1 Tax=Sandarakinorhabdus sp. TaxID=1916663 RepID=UPI00333F8DF9